MEKKIDKEFLLTDSSLNTYSYRLLTTGYLLAEFLKNPIGYYMHGTTEFPREAGVLVRWYDIRVQGDKVFGKPCINLNHPRGERTVTEIENGFLNAASMGKIVAIEISENPVDYLPGQTGPTVSKWFNRECSPVDIPGNYNALTEIVDGNDNPISLANLMGKGTMIENIQTIKPVKLDELKSVNEQIIEGVRDNTITDDMSEQLRLQFKNNPEGLNKLLAAFSEQRVEVLKLKTFSELDEEGLIEELMKRDIEHFRKLYFIEFGKEYKSTKLSTDEAINKMLIEAFKSNTIDEEQFHKLKEQYKRNLSGLEIELKNLSQKRTFHLSGKTYNELEEENLIAELLGRDKEAYKKIHIEHFETPYNK